MAVLGLSGHLLSRYIMHLGLKNTPGLISEVVGAQNPGKKLILKVFRQIYRRIGGGFLSRYIVHLGLKNTPGLIFEVPGPQNRVKNIILSVFF